MLAWVEKELLGRCSISPDDLDLMTVTDDPIEAVAMVVGAFERRTA
jgi:hypothetical protein